MAVVKGLKATDVEPPSHAGHCTGAALKGGEFTPAERSPSQSIRADVPPTLTLLDGD
ncbi:hypothetical protein NJ7G_4032 [Natrinema sp. J7-2]|nr:hypothetical protein NJ7G_4032 [Natrinema sp. J7-2]